MLRLRTALLAASLVAGLGGIALAEVASTYDPNQLPAFKGKVAQYTLTPRGDVDGLILNDGTEVHVAPRLSSALVFAVKPGDAVTIHGLHARAVPMVAAMSVTNDASGVTVQGLGHPGGENQVSAQGTIKQQLHTPRGDLSGVLLTDGTVVRLPPPEATKLGDTLAVGKTLVARGEGVDGPLGRSVAARQIGPDAEHLTEVAHPHWGGPMAWMREHMGHGEGMHGEWGHGPHDGPEDGMPPPPPAR
jgi:hypothetical protein